MAKVKVGMLRRVVQGRVIYLCFDECVQMFGKGRGRKGSKEGRTHRRQKRKYRREEKVEA